MYHKQRISLFTMALLSALFALSLQAQSSIAFNEVQDNPTRKLPVSNHEILSFNAILQQSMQSVVHIATKQKVSVPKLPPMFEQFFGKMPNKERFKQALGSGVILSKDGYIVTNFHVIDAADSIEVHIDGENRTYPATVIGKDEKSDLAVIKIERKDLQPIKMGASSHLAVGDVVFAIGNPFGVGQSVTQGIISAQNKNGIGINEYENFIQTDASINPGNSGGALVDSRGALIGINSAILSRSGGNNGIGFAIEVDMVKSIVKKLVEHGSVSHGYLGVSIGNLNKELMQVYKHHEGAMLLEVFNDTPASKAGLERGDLILTIDNKPIKNAQMLKNAIGLRAPKEKIEITYERNKRTFTTTVTIGAIAAEKNNDDSLIKGLALKNIDNNLRYQFNIPSGVEGVMITQVSDTANDTLEGVRPGDIIIQVENSTISSLKDLKQALKQYSGAYKRIYINRKGRIYVLAYK